MARADSDEPNRDCPYPLARGMEGLEKLLEPVSADTSETPPEPVQRPEARRLYRQRVLKGATIIKAFANSEITCTIRNQHPGGAELSVAADTHIPTRFLLYVPADGVAYCAEVRWRRNERVGVEFIGTRSKPRLHYG